MTVCELTIRVRADRRLALSVLRESLENEMRLLEGEERELRDRLKKLAEKHCVPVEALERHLMENDDAEHTLDWVEFKALSEMLEDIMMRKRVVGELLEQVKKG